MPCDLQNYLYQVLRNKSGACGPNLVNVANWGFNATVCQKHYDIAKYLLQSQDTQRCLDRLGDNGELIHLPFVPHFPFAGYVDDYVKLLALMQSRQSVLDCMRKLASELDKTINRQKKTKDDLDDRFHTLKKQARPYIRISRALSYYERLCLFPSSHVVFSGALTSANFYWSLRQGFMPKDPGAGSNHGDFSHRLQWHAVMRIITQDFSTPHIAGWNKTPLDLYTSLGKPDEEHRNLWGVIFDAQGRPNYSDPSNLFRDVRESPNMGALQVQLVKSYDKRTEVERVCDLIIKEVLSDGSLADVRNLITSLKKPRATVTNYPAVASVASVLYNWKKLGRPTFRDPGFHPNKDKPQFPALVLQSVDRYEMPANQQIADWQNYFDKLTEYIAARFWMRYISDYRSEVGGFLRGSRHTKYLNVENGRNAVDGVIVADDGDRMSDSNIDVRISASYNNFNWAFSYSPEFGAQPY